MTSYTYRKKKWVYLVLVLIFLLWTYSEVVVQIWNLPFELFTKFSEIFEEPPTYYVKWVDVDGSSKNRTDKSILIWDHRNIFQMTNPFFAGSTLFENCEEYNLCEIFVKDETMPLENYDAIIFDAETPISKLPAQRSFDQIYIYYSESPPTEVKIPHVYQIEFFNWTMTYRKDSDIFFPKANLIPLPEKNLRQPSPNLLKYKNVTKKPILWIEPMGGYEKYIGYVKILQGLIGLRIHRLDRSYPYLFIEDYVRFQKKHRFVLYFQDSNCLEYVSREIYVMLQFYMVPIVYGVSKENEKLFPKHSVIFASNFKTAADLASYLELLLWDPEKYWEYFEWKRKMTLDFVRTSSFCELCKNLNKPFLKKSYKRLDRWWSKKNSYNVCQEDENNLVFKKHFG